MENVEIVYKRCLTNEQFNKIIQIIDDNLDGINNIYGNIVQFGIIIDNHKYSGIEFHVATWDNYEHFIMLFDEKGVNTDFYIFKNILNMFIGKNGYLFSCPIDDVIELINNVLLN